MATHKGKIKEHNSESNTKFIGEQIMRFRLLNILLISFLFSICIVLDSSLVSNSDESNDLSIGANPQQQGSIKSLALPPYSINRSIPNWQNFSNPVGIRPKKKIRKSFGSKKVINNTKNSPDGGFAEAKSLSIVANPQHHDDYRSLLITPDNKFILTASRDRTLKLWDIETGRPVREFLGHEKFIIDAKISPDGKFIASISRENILFWNISTGELLYSIIGNRRSNLTSIVFTSDKNNIIISDYKGGIEIWNYKTKKKNQNLKLFHLYSLDRVRSLVVSNDNKYLIAAKDNIIEVIDLSSGEISKLKGHNKKVMAIAVTSDSKYLLSGGKDHYIIMWEIKTGKIVSTFKENKYEIASIAVSPDGKYAVFGGFDSAVALLNLETKKFLGHLFDSNYSYISELVYSLDGKKLFVAFDNSILVWDFENMLRGVLSEIPFGIKAIDFSPDNKKILVGGYDGTARLWSLETGELLWAFKDNMGTINSVEISPDGKYAAYAGQNKVVNLLDMYTGKPLKSFSAYNDLVIDFVFSPDSKQLVVGYNNPRNSSLVFDVISGQPLKTLKHPDPTRILRFTYSTDENFILSFSGNEIFVWDKHSGEIIKSFKKEYSLNFFTKQQNSFFAVDYGDKGPIIQEWDFNTGGKIRDFQQVDFKQVFSINI